MVVVLMLLLLLLLLQLQLQLLRPVVASLVVPTISKSRAGSPRGSTGARWWWTTSQASAPTRFDGAPGKR